MNDTVQVDENPLRKFDAPVLKSMETTQPEGNAPRAVFLPATMGEAMELGKLMAAGCFVPPHLRRAPGDCLAVVMQAARWGMDPFAVGNKTYFVNDRMAYESQLVNAVVNSSGALDGKLKVEWQGEGDNLVCIVTGKLKGDPDPKVRRVQIKTITTRNSPLWRQDPEQQLAYYTTRAWARLYCPEVLLGVYTPDEVREMAPIDGGSLNSAPLSAELIAEQAKPKDVVIDAKAAEVVDVVVEEVVDEQTGEITTKGNPFAQTDDASEGPADEQRGEAEPDADYRSDTAPQNATGGQTWYKPADGKLRFAHQTPNGIKWYFEPQQEASVAEAEKPAERSRFETLRIEIGLARDLDALGEVADQFEDAKPELTGNEITAIRNALAERRNVLS